MRIDRVHPPMLRWSIPCDETRFQGGSAHIYLTTDPGGDDEAHVLVSDPCEGAQQPVFTTTARSVEDVQRVIESIRRRIS